MGRLIEYSDITIRDVTVNLLSEEFDPWIIEAEEIDIKGVLGNRLFTDMVANQTDTNYAELLAGASYQDGEYTYEFKGVKYALQYYAWARYLENPEIHTVTGMSNHRDEFGDKPDSRASKMKADNARSVAWSIMQDCLEYLTRKSEDFPLFNCSDKNNRSSSVKFSILG